MLLLIIYEDKGKSGAPALYVYVISGLKYTGNQTNSSNSWLQALILHVH